jgi:hypothetical protein
MTPKSKSSPMDTDSSSSTRTTTPSCTSVDLVFLAKVSGDVACWPSCNVQSLIDGSSSSTEVRRYDHDDPFYSEISAMVDAVEGNAESSLLSTFEDALKTYQLTWAIRRAGEKA